GSILMMPADSQSSSALTRKYTRCLPGLILASWTGSSANTVPATFTHTKLKVPVENLTSAGVRSTGSFFFFGGTSTGGFSISTSVSPVSPVSPSIASCDPVVPPVSEPSSSVTGPSPAPRSLLVVDTVSGLAGVTTSL